MEGIIHGKNTHGGKGNKYGEEHSWKGTYKEKDTRKGTHGRYTHKKRAIYKGDSHGEGAHKRRLTEDTHTEKNTCHGKTHGGNTYSGDTWRGHIGKGYKGGGNLEGTYT